MLVQSNKKKFGFEILIGGETKFSVNRSDNKVNN